MSKEKCFLVRTFCATYNHENYITDALNGFVMQQTNFPVVYTIVDDASTDKTPEILREFVEENFDLGDTSVGYDKDTDYGHVTFARHKTNVNCCFAVIYLKENHYSQKKSRVPYLTEWMDTKYVALCEGDDYWTNSLKLQKQVDYLEKHEDCCMCTHAASWEMQGSFCKYGCQYDFPCDLTTEEVIKNGGLYLATNSLVYRSWLEKDMPKWRKESSVGDFPLQILGTLRGKLHYLPETMSVYRYMREDSWTGKHFGQMEPDDTSVKYAKNKVMWFDLLDKDTDFKYTKTIYSYLFPSYNVLFNAREISFPDYFRAAMKADEKHYGRVFKDFLIRYFKPFYKMGLIFKGKEKGK